MFTDPVKNLRAFSLTENMIVADLGAGTGYYSIPIAEMVPNGKVYAIEIQKDFLHTIINKAKQVKLNNLESIWGDVEKKNGTKIGDEIVDAVIASNILSQVEDKDGFIDEARRILKMRGRVLVVDIMDDSFVLSSKHQTISKDDARKLFEKKGFVYDRGIDAGEHHYGIIFKKEKLL